MRLATFLLEGDADQWWKVVRHLKFPDFVTIDIKWRYFESTFYEKYFPDHERDRLDQEFQSLQQGSMTVIEYEAAFARLEQFA